MTAPGCVRASQLTLDFPNGLPYESYVRKNVISLYDAGMSAEGIAEYFHGRPCLSTIRTWISRYKSNGQIPEPLPLRNGRSPTLSEEDAYALWLFKNSVRTASGRVCQHFIELACGKQISRSTISKEIVRRLGLTRNKIQNISNRRDEQQRVNWWSNGPFHPSTWVLSRLRSIYFYLMLSFFCYMLASPGVRGVPAEMLIDFDEKTCSYDECLQQLGHTSVGSRAARVGPRRRAMPPFNVLLATDVNVGAITFLMYRGTLNKSTFYCWLALEVLPAIRGTGPRILMGDNLSAHFGAEIEELLTSEGHIIRYRPVHSPDFAWVEWCFQHAQMFARINDLLLLQDPGRFGECFAAGLNSITAEYVKSYAAAAHYSILDRPYNPYLGASIAMGGEY